MEISAALWAMWLRMLYAIATLQLAGVSDWRYQIELQLGTGRCLTG